VPGIKQAEVLYWWRGQSAAYLMRLNPDTMRDVQSQRFHSGGAAFPLPKGTVNAHIRAGDKHMEMRLVAPEAYVDAALTLVQNTPLAFHTRTLFASGDDLSKVLVAKTIEQHGWTFLYSNVSRLDEGFVFTTWNERVDQRSLTTGFIMQLMMSLEADAWIGTRKSNWNRLIDEMRCVWVPKCHLQYLEVGDAVYYEW
jgi:hypothetical protein